MNIEAQVIRVPTGVQDYRPALYGGASAVVLDVDGVRRERLDLDLAALEARLVLAYTGASRNSGINNWQVMKDYLDGNKQVQSHMHAIQEATLELELALKTGRYEDAAKAIVEKLTGKAATAAELKAAGGIA